MPPWLARDRTYAERRPRAPRAPAPAAPTCARRAEAHAGAERSQSGDDVKLGGDRRPHRQTLEPLGQRAVGAERDAHAVTRTQDPGHVRDVGEPELAPAQVRLP